MRLKSTYAALMRGIGGIALLCLADVLIATQNTNDPKDAIQGSLERETILDRKVHIEKEWVLDIPDVSRLCDKLNLKKQKVNIGDCELYCEEEGKGMPIVLVNGGPGGTHHYFHPSFSRATDFSRVVYYDQRGCGLSDYNKGAGYSTVQAVDDLEKLRLVLKIDKWVVTGHSYGGYVAQHYAVKYPDHLAGLVLIGAQTAGKMPKPQSKWAYISPEERQKMTAARHDNKLTPDQRVFNAFLCGEWKLQSWFYRPSNEDVARMIRHGWGHDPQFRETINMEMPDLKNCFIQCPIPTLVLEGKYDLTWSTNQLAKMQTAFPKAQLVGFEKAAHSPFDDEPDLFFTELKKFVLQLKKPSDTELTAWKKNIMSGK